MKGIRYNYIIKDNEISDFYVEDLNFLPPYFMFRQDNLLIVNRKTMWQPTLSNKNIVLKVMKSAILLDLELLSKYKSENEFTDIKSISKDFINKVKNFNITKQDIANAMERGKVWNKNNRKDLKDFAIKFRKELQDEVKDSDEREYTFNQPTERFRKPVKRVAMG